MYNPDNEDHKKQLDKWLDDTEELEEFPTAPTRLEKHEEE